MRIGEKGIDYPFKHRQCAPPFGRFDKGPAQTHRQPHEGFVGSVPEWIHIFSLYTGCGFGRVSRTRGGLLLKIDIVANPAHYLVNGLTGVVHSDAQGA